MFGLFASVEKKMRANATNWLELADKIFHYRRDQLQETERNQLVQRIEMLRGQLRDKADASKLKLGIEGLEEVLRRTGGSFYPKSTLQEYVEFFLVAAIVVLGIRTYFIQPFKIPTNSMWPSYYGMTPQVYSEPDDAPGPVVRAARLVAFGAQHKHVAAPLSGKVGLAVVSDGDSRWQLFSEMKPGRKWLIIPTTVREYSLYVGEERIPVRVPADFDLEPVIRAYFKLQPGEVEKKIRSSNRRTFHYQVATLDREVNKGDSLLRFDLLTGDQLFVDRFSYHFFQPDVGDGFVFRTRQLTALHPQMPGPTDQYYIKRLVGAPGDQLEIRGSTLFRNGDPITGSKAFDKNARREDKYPGYLNIGLLAKGSIATVPNDKFMALGDNSVSSLDSRYWGYVPKEDVVGRPLFIYYPFTRRWGIAP